VVQNTTTPTRFTYEIILFWGGGVVKRDIQWGVHFDLFFPSRRGLSPKDSASSRTNTKKWSNHPTDIFACFCRCLHRLGFLGKPVAPEPGLSTSMPKI
jgi:hypothetical protein